MAKLPKARLQRLNRVLAIVYCLQAAAVLFLAYRHVAPITSQYISSHGLSVKVTAGFPLASIVAMALAVSGCFHALYVGSIQAAYWSVLAKRQNPYRWLAEAFSTSLLAVVVGLSVGMRDSSALLAVLVLVFLANVLVWQYEQQIAEGRGPEARRTVIMLVPAALAAVGSLGLPLLTTATAPNGRLQLPGLLAYIVLVIGFGLVGWLLVQLHQDKPAWRDYRHVEWIVSLGAAICKTVIVWLVIAASVR